jgi:hypothetical protein
MTPGKLPAELDTYSLPDFLKRSAEAVKWLIEPFVPANGIVFFHGPTSVGKSPYTWKLALSVATGEDFFGYTPKTKGSVLYLEFDTPAGLIQERLSKLSTYPENLFIKVFENPINILDLKPSDRQTLSSLNLHLSPVLVIINTLRKVHQADDKDSNVPSKVYGNFRLLFPSATLVFVHHDRKASSNPFSFENPDQAFSGSQHWMDDAQVALHITRLAKKPPKGDLTKTDDDSEEPPAHEKSRVSVKMTKSQVSDHEGHPPLILQLSPDGTNWIETGPGSYRKFFRSLDVSLKRAAKIEMTMAHFDVGKSTVYEAVKGLD